MRIAGTAQEPLHELSSVRPYQCTPGRMGLKHGQQFQLPTRMPVRKGSDADAAKGYFRP